MNRKHANFYIAFKILLRKGDEFLFLRLSSGEFLNILDLPGGRAEEGEEEIPIEEILKREIEEEIGKNVKYKIGKLIFQHYRRVNKPYVLVSVYEGEYLSGDIELSSEHLGYEWINPKTYHFKKEEFFSEKEYFTFRKYFNFEQYE